MKTLHKVPDYFKCVNCWRVYSVAEVSTGLFAHCECTGNKFIQARWLPRLFVKYRSFFNWIEKTVERWF